MFSAPPGKKQSPSGTLSGFGCQDRMSALVWSFPNVANVLVGFGENAVTVDESTNNKAAARIGLFVDESERQSVPPT
jgi:hypothetical protein